MPQTHDLAKRDASGRPPRYAAFSLLFFGCSFAMLGVAVWIHFTPAEPVYRRGYTPVTNEEQLDLTWLADPEVEHMLAPNVRATLTNEDGEQVTYESVKIGSACFRDDGIQGPVFAVAVGDSFTFGHMIPLDSCFVELLERKLEADVANLGVTNSFGSTQIERTLKRNGLPLHPKLVIWAAFVNDWMEDTLFLAWEGIDRSLDGQFEFPRSRSIWDAMRRHIYVTPSKRAEGMAQSPPLDAIVRYERDGLHLSFDATSYAAQDLRIPAIAKGWETSRTAIRRAAKASLAAGAEFIVMTIPTKEDVYHDRACEVLSYAKECRPAVFCSAIEDFCREERIHCLNLYPVLKKHADEGEQIYFGEDGHFNRLGHAIAAAALFEFLKTKGLMPDSELVAARKRSPGGADR